MQSRNRMLDDLARVASGAAGTLAGVKGEVEMLVRQRIETILSDLNLVTREEFEAVRDMAAKARREQEKLEARVAELEAILSESGSAGPKSPSKPSSKGPKTSSAKKKSPTASDK